MVQRRVIEREGCSELVTPLARAGEVSVRDVSNQITQQERDRLAIVRVKRRSPLIPLRSTSAS